MNIRRPELKLHTPSYVPYKGTHKYAPNSPTTQIPLPPLFPPSFFSQGSKAVIWGSRNKYLDWLVRWSTLEQALTQLAQPSQATIRRNSFNGLTDHAPYRPLFSYSSFFLPAMPASFLRLPLSSFFPSSSRDESFLLLPLSSFFPSSSPRCLRGAGGALAIGDADAGGVQGVGGPLQMDH